MPINEAIGEAEIICEVCELTGGEEPAGIDENGKFKAIWVEYDEFAEDFYTCDRHFDVELQDIPGALKLVKGSK